MYPVESFRLLQSAKYLISAVLPLLSYVPVLYRLSHSSFTWPSSFSWAAIQGLQLGCISGATDPRNLGGCTQGKAMGRLQREACHTQHCQAENWALLCLRKSKSCKETFNSVRLTDSFLNFPNAFLITEFDLPMWRIKLCQHRIIFNLSNFIKVMKRIINLVWICSMKQVCWHLYCFPGKSALLLTTSLQCRNY